MAFLCRLHDCLYAVRAADVARIQANLVHAGLDRRQRETVVKMNVRDHRQRRAGADFAQRLRRLHIRHGTANNVAARVRQCANLRQSSLRVARVRVGHGLHRDGRAAANQYVPYLDLLCYFHSSNLSQMENGEWRIVVSRYAPHIHFPFSILNSQLLRIKMRSTSCPVTYTISISSSMSPAACT